MDFDPNMDLDDSMDHDPNIDLNPDKHGLFKRATPPSPDQIIADEPGRRSVDDNKTFAEPDKSVPEQAQRRVACDQRLPPGMRQHWGEVRKCETHSRNQPPFPVCKGCRVSHPTPETSIFNRPLNVKYGAGVGVCTDCNQTVLADAACRVCVCNKLWTCFICRKVELKILAKVRKRSTKYNYGKCFKIYICGHEIFFCMPCEGWRMDLRTNHKFEENPMNDEWQMDGPSPSETETVE
jgi:hypothetical protein